MKRGQFIKSLFGIAALSVVDPSKLITVKPIHKLSDIAPYLHAPYVPLQITPAVGSYNSQGTWWPKFLKKLKN